jgi:hypothetical protein
MTERIGGVVRVAATALVALVLAHNLIFLAGYGAAFSEAMAHTGHHHGWAIAVVVSLALACSLLFAAAWRLRQLGRLARELGAPRLPTEPNRRAFLLRWLALWLALTIGTALLFVLQENIEHARITQRLPGIGVLASAAYPHAVEIIAAVSLAVSLVAALLGWKLELVIARIRAMQSAARGAGRPVCLPSDWIDRRRGSILGRRLAGRAPPLGFPL